MSVFSGSVTIPKVGTVPKPAIILIGGGAAAYVGWRWWVARGAGGEAPADETADFGDAGQLPSVAGAVDPNQQFGLPPDEPASTDTFGFTGKTNSQWTIYCTTQLSQSAKWEYTDIVNALGNYLSNKPLDPTGVQIVQAAIAVAGYPPEGSHVIIPGGTSSGGEDTSTITVAPGGLKVTAIDEHTLKVTWSAVAGAAHYRVYRSGAAENVADSIDTIATIGGLQGDTSYTVQVAAVSSTGKVGPKSSGVKGTTKAVTLKAPTGLRAESVTKTTVALRWNTVTGASGYRIYHQLSHENIGSSVDTRATIGGLRANTTYKIHVRAQDNKGQTGPSSNVITIKTKKK